VSGSKEAPNKLHQRHEPGESSEDSSKKELVEKKTFTGWSYYNPTSGIAKNGTSLNGRGMIEEGKDMAEDTNRLFPGMRKTGDYGSKKRRWERFVLSNQKIINSLWEGGLLQRKGARASGIV